MGLATLWIPYSMKLSREKTFMNWWKIRFFSEKTFVDCSILLSHTQISQRTLSWIATKPQNSRKFSPSKVFRYMVVSTAHCAGVCRSVLSVTLTCDSETTSFSGVSAAQGSIVLSLCTQMYCWTHLLVSVKEQVDLTTCFPNYSTLFTKGSSLGHMLS